MQAIVTKYVGPTNYRGSRVIAKCEAKRIAVSWDDALNVDENHRRAAQILATELEWRGRWVGGSLPDNRGYCFVWGGRNGGGFAGVFEVREGDVAKR